MTHNRFSVIFSEFEKWLIIQSADNPAETGHGLELAWNTSHDATAIVVNFCDTIASER
jgi:hypothetical protein